MKRVLWGAPGISGPAVLFALLLAIGLAACGSDGDDVAEDADVVETDDADAADDAADDEPADDDADDAEADEPADADTDDAEADEPAAADTDDAEADEPADADAAAGNEVTLVEWEVMAETSYQAGEVSFVATNGGEFPHELAIARGDSYDTLPQTSTGAVDEAALGADFLGRTDRISPGDNATLTMDLEAGNYVIFCNLGSGPNSHAAAGQVLSITVEG